MKTESMKTFKHANKKYLSLGALVIAGVLFVWLLAPRLSKEGLGEANNAGLKSHVSLLTSGGITHAATVMQPDLYPTLNKVDEVPIETEKVYGGIVSHHFYMEEDISKLFLQLRNQSPSVVVIVGPNHFNAGNADIQTSIASYATPFGQLESDLPLISSLVADGVAAHEEFAFEREHSIAALVGFTKRVFPNTKLVPIIIRRSTSPARTVQLAAELNKILPKDALVLASVDFSHHLDRFAAGFHDSQSVSALLSTDFNRIRNLEVDSPQSLEVLMRYLQSRGALYMEYKNTNQALYGGNLLSDDVTSYIFAKFTASFGSPSQGGESSSSSLQEGRLGGVIVKPGDASKVSTTPSNSLPSGGGQEGTATFLHFGNFDAKTLKSNEDKALYALGGPENNFLRGGDLKVVGTSGDDCALNGIPTLARYSLQIFRAGKCAERVIVGSDIQTGNVGFMYAGPGDDLEGLLSNAKENYKYLIVQTKNLAQAKISIDAGADAVFVEDFLSKVELYKNKPIIHLAAPGQSGFSTGIVFGDFSPQTWGESPSASGGERGRFATIYLFPYYIKNNELTRPDISERLRTCKQILAGLKNVDGCSASIQ